MCMPSYGLLAWLCSMYTSGSNALDASLKVHNAGQQWWRTTGAISRDTHPAVFSASSLRAGLTTNQRVSKSTMLWLLGSASFGVADAPLCGASAIGEGLRAKMPAYNKCTVLVPIFRILWPIKTKCFSERLSRGVISFGRCILATRPDLW